MFIVLLLAACSKDGESPEETQPVINIYVYSPNNPTVTRGDVGNVDPINNDLNESLITSLQIWAFKHGTEELVSYYQPETVRNLNEDKGVTYQLIVSDDFSKADPKPNVDVYVVANAASCGLSSLGKSTTRAALEDAKIGSAYFGLSPLTDKVPEAGLPMSGVLRDVALTGMAPVFKISSVTLTRTVSKLRFIFSRDDGNTVKITSIKLGAIADSENTLSQIPTEEYIFLKADHSLYNIGSTYEAGGTELLPEDSPLREDIKSNEDPLKYAYQSGQNAQDYEDLIALGLSENKLSGVGPYYLRESDKKLSGVITYQKGNAEETMKATFEMKAAGDFSRNHTWIVYAYYGVDGMQVVTVYSQNWTEVTSESHDVYNW
jgi:hypothetical protein